MAQVIYYFVECSYNDPDTEVEWNAYYNFQKIPALLSVDGFMTSQRFRAVSKGCPDYLALHTLRDAEVLKSNNYRNQGGGNFSTWQGAITQWRRSLYTAKTPAKAILNNELLLLSHQPLSELGIELGFEGVQMFALGGDIAFSQGVKYRLLAEVALQFRELPGVFIYEPLIPQYQSKPVNPSNINMLGLK